MTPREKVIFAIATVILLVGIYRIYAKSDGKKGMSLPEFQKMAAFLLFYGIIIFMVKVEADRERVEHVFSDLWMAFAITGLFSSLHMDDILTKMTDLIRAIIQLRTSTPEPPPTVQVTKTEVEVK